MPGGHRDILDQRDSLGRPLAGSLVLHGLLFASVAAYSLLLQGARERWGDPNSLGGGGFSVTPVDQIPLPQVGGVANPVANDTESRVPAPPKQDQKKRAPAEDPDAISLKTKRLPKKQSDVVASRQRYRSPAEERPNQLYSSTGQAMSNPMFGTRGGSGGVGVGPGSPFGSRYGWYANLLAQRLAQAWRTQDVNPRLAAAPPVIVTFVIQRDGRVGDLRLIQRSGDLSLDNSVLRAVMQASPLPELPRDYQGSSVTVEYWFELKR